MAVVGERLQHELQESHIGYLADLVRPDVGELEPCAPEERAVHELAAVTVLVAAVDDIHAVGRAGFFRAQGAVAVLVALLEGAIDLGRGVALEQLGVVLLERVAPLLLGQLVVVGSDLTIFFQKTILCNCYEETAL